MAAVTQAIIGTAGHIDHGKTALIKALTGQDTDRLQEEKARGISIDLGFAYLTLDDGRRAGIVDVPGHERFIHNMLAGAHGIDLVLFVVAADDGVMPQSEEHFDLLHLLGVNHGIFVISKADLVAPARIAEVIDEIRLMAEGSALASAPVLAVSSVTGAGMAQLRAEITKQLSVLPARTETGVFRLPIDRAFIIKGHGTVVTGTAQGAGVRVGQKLRVLPEGGEVRVRAIEIHGQQVARALSSQRVALNLSGAERLTLARGAVLADERLDISSNRLDVLLEVRPGARRPLASNDRIRLYLGTAQVLGRVIVLEAGGNIAPRHTGLAQLILQTPVVATGRDRFVVRDEADQRTLGGGVVLNPLGQSLRRPRDLYRERLARLGRLPQADAVEAFLNLQNSFALDADAIAIALGRAAGELADALADPCLIQAGTGTEQIFTTRDKWESLKRTVSAAVLAYHRQAPLAPGIELEALRLRLPFAIGAREFKPLLDRLAPELGLVRTDNIVRAADHRSRLLGTDREAADRIVAAMARAGLQMPDLKSVGDKLGFAEPRLRSLMAALERQGEIVRIGTDQYLLPDDVARARLRLDEFLREHHATTAAAYRDLLGVSRRVAIALLDYFDHAGITTRVGDERRLRQHPAPPPAVTQATKDHG
jgi:selenocysteine-specific elongation factor